MMKWSHVSIIDHIRKLWLPHPIIPKTHTHTQLPPPHDSDIPYQRNKPKKITHFLGTWSPQNYHNPSNTHNSNSFASHNTSSYALETPTHPNTHNPHPLYSHTRMLLPRNWKQKWKCHLSIYQPIKPYATPPHNHSQWLQHHGILDIQYLMGVSRSPPTIPNFHPYGLNTSRT